MSDPAKPPCHWLDLHRSPAPAPPVLPEELRGALEKLATQIATVQSPQIPRLTRYFEIDPGHARFNRLVRSLPLSALDNLLDRLTGAGRAPSVSALSSADVAMLARKALLSRLLDPSRLFALQQAMAAIAAAGRTQEQCP